jgi:ribosomal protein L24
MIVKKHVKPMPQMNREGGIREQEAWVSISNVAIIDPDTGKPTKVKYEFQDGKKVRIAKSGKVIPENASYKREKKKAVEDEEETPAPDEAGK